MIIVKVLEIGPGPAAARLLGGIREENAVVLNPHAVGSCEELELANYLAEKSFENGRNIANKFKYEFLLWLSGTRDIKNAIKKTKPEKNRPFLLVAFSGMEGIKGRKPNLKKEAEPLALERISLSRL
ncbi:hypothetical protein GF318_02920 [Candidatus Micrarchaeota archaeon]|nr:hypothetical protein [Candidatus Micrarchaeota archaeon]